MRIVVAVGLLLCSALLAQGYDDGNFEDDDFAEFEQFEGDEDVIENEFEGNGQSKDGVAQKQKPAPPVVDKFQSESFTEDDIIVEDDENEFEHFQDPEEFEGYQDTPPKASEQPKITITEVPITTRARWDAYWLEGVFCCILAVYAVGYVIGRSKNTSIALNFLKAHKHLLEDNFTLVGETGPEDVVSLPEGGGGWRREAEHVFTLWCSGRVCCEGMLLTLKLIKRQDIVSLAIGLARPSPDTLQIKVELGKEDSDPFVLCVAQKKTATRLAREMQDLSVFCPEKRPGDKHGLPASLAVLSESAEATAAMLDSKVTLALNLYHKYVQYIHISDKYCGPKQTEETAPTKPPETERALLASFTIDEDADDEAISALICLTLYLTDKIKRNRLSKEALYKCEKRRQKVAELWMKSAHAARQEEAALRREEKRKQEKERILAEDDPEKQRRWELKEQKRQQKRKTPKMKQLKVKAL